MDAVETKSEPSKTQRQKFSHDEDQKLIKFVAIYGNRAWKKIAKEMKTRSTRQCRERYINYLSPNLKNGPWTSQEDSFLISKVKEMGPCWSKIVKFFPTRSDVNIKNRYALFVSKGKAPLIKTKQHTKQKSSISAKVPDESTKLSLNISNLDEEVDQIWDDKIFSNEFAMGDLETMNFDT